MLVRERSDVSTMVGQSVREITGVQRSYLPVWLAAQDPVPRGGKGATPLLPDGIRSSADGTATEIKWALIPRPGLKQFTWAANGVSSWTSVLPYSRSRHVVLFKWHHFPMQTTPRGDHHPLPPEPPTQQYD